MPYQSRPTDLAAGAPRSALFPFGSDALGPDPAFIAVAGVLHGGGSLALVFAPFDVLGDRDPPIVTITGLVDGQCSTSPVVPEITVDDASPVTVDIRLDGAAFVSGTAVTGEGAHLLAVHAEDIAANATDASVGFVVDDTPPLVTITGVADGAIVSSATAGMTVTDANPADQTMTLDGAPYAPGAPIDTEGPHALARLDV